MFIVVKTEGVGEWRDEATVSDSVKLKLKAMWVESSPFWCNYRPLNSKMTVIIQRR